MKQTIIKTFKWIETGILTIIRFLFNHKTIMAGATLVIAYFAIQQTGIIDQQTSIIEQQKIISQNIADISEQTLKTAYRPYLVIDDIELKQFILDGRETEFLIGERFAVTFTIRNKGQTPAYNVVDSVRVDIMHSDTTLCMPPSNWTNQYIVGSEIKRFKQSQDALSKKDIDKVNSGESWLYFWGKVSYIDIAETPYYVEFGYTYIFRHEDWFPYEEYNKAN